eukprot:762977-Hanusia_phi.AAC.3
MMNITDNAFKRQPGERQDCANDPTKASNYFPTNIERFDDMLGSSDHLCAHLQNFFSPKNSLLMQDLSTFRQIQDKPLLRRALALKLLLSQYPIYTLLFFLCHLFFSQTYLLRIAGASCLFKRNLSDRVNQRGLPINLIASIGQTRCG